MGPFVETWKGIAPAVKRSERWCRYMARRTNDPLPVFKVGGIVRLYLADYEAWLGRQRGSALGELAIEDLEREPANVVAPLRFAVAR